MGLVPAFDASPASWAHRVRVPQVSPSASSASSWRQPWWPPHSELAADVHRFPSSGVVWPPRCWRARRSTGRAAGLPAHLRRPQSVRSPLHRSGRSASPDAHRGTGPDPTVRSERESINASAMASSSDGVDHSASPAWKPNRGSRHLIGPEHGRENQHLIVHPQDRNDLAFAERRPWRPRPGPACAVRRAAAGTPWRPVARAPRSNCDRDRWDRLRLTGRNEMTSIARDVLAGNIARSTSLSTDELTWLPTRSPAPISS